jgi:hypothetical protein
MHDKASYESNVIVFLEFPVVPVETQTSGWRYKGKTKSVYSNYGGSNPSLSYGVNRQAVKSEVS